jgi:hypothetical protein
LTHAFLITAYKDEEQLSSLVTQLLKYDSLIYIHIDKKSKSLQKNFRDRYAGNDRVKIIADPVKVYWGGFSHLNAILILLEKAYENPANSRFHLLSGQDLPIRSKKDFDAFFEINGHKEYITNFKLPAPQWQNGGLDRIKYYHLNDILDPKKYFFPRINGRFIRLQKWLGMKRKQPSYISDYYGGGTWWTLRREAVNEIMSFTKKHPDFVSCFKHTYCGEEIFFQTILCNSKLKVSIISEDLRYIDWSAPDGKFPPVLDESYLEKMYQKEIFFARKFDSGVAIELRKKIEAVVNGE